MLVIDHNRRIMNFLFKEEPDNYSYDAFAQDKRTTWTGVRNPVAQKHLRSVKKGDRIFYYHTGNEKAIVGIAKAIKNAYADPSGTGHVVDIAPVNYGSRGEFAGYVEAMQALDLGSLGRRADADTALKPAVPNRTVRNFLLQNLQREGEGWRWQVNLEVLGRDLDALTDWPAKRLEGLAPFEGQVVWVAGGDSDYVRSEQQAEMRRLFPHNRKIVIKGAGHWVHAQRPEVVVEVLRQLAV